MRKELQDCLFERFPLAFKGLRASKDDWPYPITQRGVEMDDGWFALLFTFGETLERAIEKLDPEGQRHSGIKQAKQKFSTFTVYYSLHGHDDALYAELQSTVASMLRSLENESRHVCETCGQDGKKKNMAGAICTYCDECYAK